LRAQEIEVDNAAGRLLSNLVFQSGGKKLLARGHQISEEDIRLLGTAGHKQVWVAVLDDSEVAEEEAALRIATEAACGAMEIRISAGGRANLFATEECCLLLDEALLREVNLTGCVTIATTPNLAYAVAGQRLASVKTAPFAVSKKDLDEVLRLVTTKGPILQARPIRNATVGVLYSDPLQGERARRLFEGIMKTRLERLATSAAFVLTAKEDEVSVARSLDHLLRARPTVVLIASTTAPAGPEDIVGCAMKRVGCRIERFLAPVEPGNLLLLSYAGEIPVVAAPGCFRSPKLNVVDMILPPLLARYPLSAAEISSLGHGGLLL
jgi:molybdenum cofactor cytidylyltransferase